MYIIFFIVFHYSGNSKKSFVCGLLLIYLGLMMYVSGWDKPFFNGKIGRSLMGFFIGCAVGEILNFSKAHKQIDKILLCVCITGVLVLTVLPIISGYTILKEWGLLYIRLLSRTDNNCLESSCCLKDFINKTVVVFRGNIIFGIFDTLSYAINRKNN
jgi:hypothetical protein